jgi:hypothetical protein
MFLYLQARKLMPNSLKKMVPNFQKSRRKKKHLLKKKLARLQAKKHFQMPTKILLFNAFKVYLIQILLLMKQYPVRNSENFKMRP